MMKKWAMVFWLAGMLISGWLAARTIDGHLDSVTVAGREEGIRNSGQPVRDADWTGLDAAAETYEWDFGDGSPHEFSQFPTHFYTRAGTYTWSCTIRSGSESCVKTGTVRVLGGIDTGITYDWDFGDGSAHSPDPVASHIYANPGYYTWSCTVRSGGETCLKTGVVRVLGPEDPSPQYEWNFGDGPGRAYERFAQHVYQQAGTYAWTLKVTAGGTVCMKSGVIKIGYSPAVTYEWDFGDGTPHSFEQMPQHEYTSPGVYTWMVTIISGSELCTRSGRIQVVGQNTGLYEWDFGDGSPRSYEQNPVHVYSRPGTYHWLMTVSRDGFTCGKTGDITVAAGPNQPPGVTITTPAPGSLVSGNVAIGAQVSDDNPPVSKVECLVDGTLLGALTAAPFTWTWNAAGASSGAHTLVVRATDSQGLTGQDQVVVYTSNISARPVIDAVANLQEACEQSLEASADQLARTLAYCYKLYDGEAGSEFVEFAFTANDASGLTTSIITAEKGLELQGTAGAVSNAASLISAICWAAADDANRKRIATMLSRLDTLDSRQTPENLAVQIKSLLWNQDGTFPGYPLNYKTLREQLAQKCQALNAKLATTPLPAGYAANEMATLVNNSVEALQRAENSEVTLPFFTRSDFSLNLAKIGVLSNYPAAAQQFYSDTRRKEAYWFWGSVAAGVVKFAIGFGTGGAFTVCEVIFGTAALATSYASSSIEMSDDSKAAEMAVRAIAAACGENASLYDSSYARDKSRTAIVPALLADIENSLGQPVKTADFEGYAGTVTNLSIPDIYLTGIENVAKVNAFVEVQNTGTKACRFRSMLDIYSQSGNSEQLYSIGSETQAGITLQPGEKRRIDLFTQVPPLHYGLTPYRMDLNVVFGPRLITLNRQFDLVNKANFHIVSPTETQYLGQVNTQTVAGGSTVPGQNVEKSFTVDPQATKVTFKVRFDKGDLDLHVRDQLGNHVGLNYETGLVELDINGATYSGPQSNPEVITVPKGAGNYSVSVTDRSRSGSLLQLVSLSKTGHANMLAEDAENYYSLEAVQVKELPAIQTVEPGELLIAGAPGGRAEFGCTLRETGGQQSLSAIQVWPGVLTGANGSTLTAAAWTIDFPETMLEAGGIMNISGSVQLPATAYFPYTGKMQVESSAGLVEVPVRIVNSTTLPLSPPGTPANLTAKPGGNDRIVIAWQDITEFEEGFVIERRAEPVGEWQQLATAAANTSGYTDAGLLPGKRFSYRVKAYNILGESFYSNLASASTYIISGNFKLGGMFGIGRFVPERALHLTGGNAVFRMDRSESASAFLMVRTDGAGAVQKGFLAGTEATEANTGQFVFRDTGTSVADGAGTNRLVIGNDGTVTFGETVKAKSFVTTSSARWKENVVPLENAAELVSRLHGVRYRWKAEVAEAPDTPGTAETGTAGVQAVDGNAGPLVTASPAEISSRQRCASPVQTGSGAGISCPARTHGPDEATEPAGANGAGVKPGTGAGGTGKLGTAGTTDPERRAGPADSAGSACPVPGGPRGVPSLNGPEGRSTGRPSGTAGVKPGTGGGGEDLGFIAEEVVNVVPEAVMVAVPAADELPDTAAEPGAGGNVPGGNGKETGSSAVPQDLAHSSGVTSTGGMAGPGPAPGPEASQETTPGSVFGMKTVAAPRPGMLPVVFSSPLPGGAPGRQAAISPPAADGVVYGKLLAVALECLKEQQARLDEITRKRDAIRQRLAELADDKR